MKPFCQSIVGSWLFTRSTGCEFIPRSIFHFTVDGINGCEVDDPTAKIGEGRFLARMKYKMQGATLTLIYTSGSQTDFALTEEDDGTVRVPDQKGRIWWMTRLERPEPFSRAFVGSDGLLFELPKPQANAAIISQQHPAP